MWGPFLLSMFCSALLPILRSEEWLVTLPTGLVVAPVTFGRATTHLGTEVQMDVVVRPSERLVYAATGDVLSDLVDSFTVPLGDSTFVMFPSVDQAGIVGADGEPVTFWHYVVEVTESRFVEPEGVVNSPYRVKGATATYTKQLQPTGTAAIDFDLLPVQGAVASPLGPVYMGPAPAPDGTDLWFDTTDPTNIIVKRAVA